MSDIIARVKAFLAGLPDHVDVRVNGEQLRVLLADCAAHVEVERKRGASVLADILNQYNRRNEMYKDAARDGSELPDDGELTLYLSARQIRSLLRSPTVSDRTDRS